MALSLQLYTWSFYRDRDSSSNQRNECQHVSATIVAATEDGGGLSEDLITEILSRLPVADLSRYKCVCKYWYSLISSSDFISKHLQNYYQNDRSWHGCLLALYYITAAELNLFELSIDDTPKVLASESLDNRTMYNLAYSVCEAYGFGFDPLTKDYKVAVIKCYCSKDYEAETVTLPASIFVYSLRTDSWTYCGDLSQIYDFGLYSNQCYKFLDGSYYWLSSSGAKDENDCVISFDMATDAYQEIHTPIYEKPASRGLAIYHNSLAYLTVHVIQKDFVIWISGCGPRNSL